MFQVRRSARLHGPTEPAESNASPHNTVAQQLPGSNSYTSDPHSAPSAYPASESTEAPLPRNTRPRIEGAFNTSPQRIKSFKGGAPLHAAPASPSQREEVSAEPRHEVIASIQPDGDFTERHAAELAAMEHDQRGLMNQVCAATPPVCRCFTLRIIVGSNSLRQIHVLVIT